MFFEGVSEVAWDGNSAQEMKGHSIYHLVS